jgi:hypothetical protein
MSGVNYTSEVLNQRGAPALFEDILTNRPAAGFVGRLFFATDVTSGNTIFRDNGTTWDALAGNGGGGGGVSTLSNGLTLTGSNGTLGGTLTNDTLINSSTYVFKILSNNVVGNTAIFGSSNSGNEGAVKIGNSEINGVIQAINSSTNAATQLKINNDGGGITIGGGTNLNIDPSTDTSNFTSGSLNLNSANVASSIFTVASTTKGALLPRMSIGQRIAITSPATGLLVYDTTLLLLYQYNGTAWVSVGGTDTNIYNTSGTLTADRTLTNSTFSLTIAGTTSSRFFANGNVGIGTTTDAGYKIDINGTSRLLGNVTLGTISASSGFYWDNTNNRVGIGTNTPAAKFEINTTGSQSSKIRLSSGTLYVNGIDFYDSSVGAQAAIGTTGSGFTYGTYTPNQIFLSSSYGIGLRCSTATTSNIIFWGKNADADFSTKQFTFFGASGNFLLQDAGTHTDTASSRLTITSTTQGVLLPRMTTTQKNAILTPATGLIVYDTTLNKLALYTGAAWETVTSL